MRNKWVALAVTFALSLSANASPITVKPIKKNHVKSTTDFIVYNGENFPVDMCLSDALTGPTKIELSPFQVERYINGDWATVPTSAVGVHFVTELFSNSTQTFTIHMREPGRYRLVLNYGRALADDKGCETLFRGLTYQVHSHAFDVQ